jgi:hypothetical protein
MKISMREVKSFEVDREKADAIGNGVVKLVKGTKYIPFRSQTGYPAIQCTEKDMWEVDKLINFKLGGETTQKEKYSGDGAYISFRPRK